METYCVRVTATRKAVPAYQVLAETLRERILSRELEPGQRLPVEPDLSAEYGVSRSTVREALRVLSTQNLVRTTRGVAGGSFVAYPRPDQISGYLEASLGMLARSNGLTLDALLEARELLEVPAAGLAATRRSGAELDQLRGTVLDPSTVDKQALLDRHRTFHEVLFRASGNPLVEVLARPLFMVLNERFLRERAPAAFWSQVHRDHQSIIAAVAAGDASAAQDATRAHLRNMRPTFVRIDGSGRVRS